MSYDLFLTSPQINEQVFSQYFSGRDNYNTPGRYINEDTGVYFQFTYTAESFEQGAVGGRVEFNLNYHRPHVFGLEAEPEVTALVETFGCTIQDSQLNGMGNGPYSSAGFLRGWNHGNLFGYKVIGAKNDLKDFLLVDEALIEKVWRWNLQLKTRQSGLGEDRFLPRAYWARRASDNEPIIFAVWGEGVWMALPDCITHVLLMRKRMVSNGWFNGKKEVMEAKLVGINEIALLDGCEWRDTLGSRLLLAPDAPPAPHWFATLFKDAFDQKAFPQAIPTDHVLDAALMAQARQNGLLDPR